MQIPATRYKKWRLKNLLERAYDWMVGHLHIEEKCFICGSLPKTRRLNVDHCHRTNVVRGLLCYSCNYGLGVFRDNPARLRAAADYLDSQSKSKLTLEFFDQFKGSLYRDKQKLKKRNLL